jgi:membrane-associated protein
MDAIRDFLHQFRGEGLENLIQWGGLLILFAIVFAETGLLVGFFLPGDSLLFVAGALVGRGVLKAPVPFPQDPVTGILVLNVVLMVAAIVGDSVGYWFGRKTGPPLFNRPNSRLFKREYLEKTQEFYEKHGGKTIILARWVPFIRTFAPIIAGVAQMPYRTFMFYNVIGGVTWVLVCSLLGFFLAKLTFSFMGFHFEMEKDNEKAIMVIVALSLLPPIVHFIKERAAHKRKLSEDGPSDNTASSLPPDPNKAHDDDGSTELAAAEREDARSLTGDGR